MLFREKIRQYKRRQELNFVRKYAFLPSNSIFASDFSVDLRYPKEGKRYLDVGNYSVLHCRVVFESEDGYVKIGNRVHIGGGTTLISRNSIIIEDDVLIGWNVTVYDHNSHSIYWNEREKDVLQEYKNLLSGDKDGLGNKEWSHVVSGKITIQKKAWIGFGATILKGVTIGEGAIVGAGSVVTKNVEPYTMVAGNPAKFVKKIEETRDNECK